MSDINTIPQPAVDYFPNPWWGSFELQNEHAMTWEFGEKSISIGRLKNEWRIWDAPLGVVRDPNDNVGVKLEQNQPLPDTSDGLHRYAFANTTPEFLITPRNPDRSVVARPEVPLTIPPSEMVLLYISCPIWLQIDVHPTHVKLADIPVYRPSDIWFGANTREGTLCYSSRTSAHMDLDKLSQQPQSSVTPLRLSNAGNAPFILEKLNIPAPYLSLFTTNEGNLWTEEIHIIREADTSNVSLKIGKQPVQAPTLVSAPRIIQSQSSLLTSVSQWLG